MVFFLLKMGIDKGKSTILMVSTRKDGEFSMAMLVYRRVDDQGIAYF